MAEIIQGTSLVTQDVWSQLGEVELDPRHLERRHIVTMLRRDPAHFAFDMLRTRVMQTLVEKRWSRIGITSPTVGCGKTFVAANLALSQARRPDSRTVLVDLDLRNPELAETLGLSGASVMRNYLEGHIAPENFFVRVGETLALGLNTEPVADSAELLQDTMTGDVLDEMHDVLTPDLVLFDLPPVLASDDVLSISGQLDAVLLVIGGGTTLDEDVRRTEKLLENNVPLLGVVMNRAEDATLGK